MIDEIKKLVEVQQLDAKVFGIKRELELFPEKMKAFDELIKEKESIFKDSEDKLKQLRLKRKDKEVELQAKEESITKHQNQLYQLKSNQEYTTMQKEIKSQTADKSVLEEEILNIFDEVETAEKELNNNKNLYEQEKTKIESEKQKMGQTKKQLEEEQKKIEGQRSELTKNIDKGILSKYERILSAKSGLAIVPIDDDACGGCNMNLPPQVIDETRMGKDIVICGNCSRMLYSKE